MNFDFPDIADFPENTAPRNEGYVNVRCQEDIEDVIQSAVKFNPDIDVRILKEQVGRIVSAWGAYTKTQTNWSSQLAVEGILSCRHDVSDLRDFFSADGERLRASDGVRKSIKEVDRVLTRNDEPALDIVTEFLEDTGLLVEAMDYRDVTVRSVTVHLASPGDRHHYQTFADCETVTKLLNLHVDPKPGVVKAIIYLEIDDGPFQFIKGSNRWNYDEIQRIFAWGNSVGNYCHTPEHRAVANAFPSRYRRNAIVGRLIPDGTALSDLLLDSLTTYESDNVMLFDPCFGLHRGGLCETGTRLNLQVVMK